MLGLGRQNGYSDDYNQYGKAHKYLDEPSIEYSNHANYIESRRDKIYPLTDASESHVEYSDRITSVTKNLEHFVEIKIRHTSRPC